MSTSLVTLRKKKASIRSVSRPTKVRASVVRPMKLNLDAEEIALHAAVSAAVARDLGR
jgi:hypothetical protein